MSSFTYVCASGQLSQYLQDLNLPIKTSKTAVTNNFKVPKPKTPKSKKTKIKKNQNPPNETSYSKIPKNIVQLFYFVLCYDANIRSLKFHSPPQLHENMIFIIIHRHYPISKHLKTIRTRQNCCHWILTKLKNMTQFIITIQ